MSVDSSLCQRRSNNRLTQCNRLFLRLCTNNLHFKQCSRTLSITCNLLRQSSINIIQRSLESLVILTLLSDLRILSQTIGQKKNCIIGRNISINRIPALIIIFSSISVFCHITFLRSNQMESPSFIFCSSTGFIKKYSIRILNA